MNKLLIALSAVSALSLATFDAAEAQQRGYGNRGYNNVYRNNGNRYVQNNFYGNRGGYYGRRGGGWNNGAAWAAGLGGLAVGAIIGGALSQPAYGYPAPAYAAPVPGPNCVQVQVSQRLVPNGVGGYVQAPVYAMQCY